MREKRYLGTIGARLEEARRRIHAESGFALIEVVVSAALLMIVAAGVLAGIDGPSAVAAKSEARSQGAALAQQDQERLRSKPISQLSGLTQTRSVPVGNPPVTYSVYSKVIWVRDSNDTSSCTVPVDDTSGDYLKITSRVTPPAGNGAPVELNSLLAAPGGTYAATKGDLAVRLTDQADQPVVGQSVSITGPQSMSVPTNSEGCAVFGAITQGTYNVSFSRAGWVNPAGVSNVVLSTAVNAGSTNLVNHRYAQQATIVATVDTAVNGVVSNSPAKAVTVSNGGIPTGTRVFTASTGTQYTFTLNGLFPFTDGYAVWAGGCTSGNPLTYSRPGVTATPLPGGSVPVTLRQPAIHPTQATNVPGYGTFTFPQGVSVMYTSTDSGCNEVYSQVTNSSGKVPNPGVPYGNYKLCASYGGARARLEPYVNNTVAGFGPQIPYQGNGNCP
jgi:Tfp pilus assembly protein PilV